MNEPKRLSASQRAAKPSRSPDRKSFALHLGVHAVGEYLMLGTTGPTFDFAKPCPYCGQLPPKGAS